MTKEKIPTQFAPAEKVSPKEIERQSDLFSHNPLMSAMVNAIPDLVLIINEQRQMVYANKMLVDLLGLTDAKPVCGLRPGELLNCVHAKETEGGCGTTEFCQTCGAVKAIMSSIGGKADVQECRIIQKDSGDALDLKVWATPLQVQEEKFTVFAVKDISDEKRRKALERTFFHDILNTAAGLQGTAEMIKNAPPDELKAKKETIQQLSEKLVEEILAQRQILAAEKNKLQVKQEAINTLEYLQKIVELYQYLKVAKDRKISIDKNSVSTLIISDHNMLKQVVGNMLKNALEAAQPGETVTLGCKKEADIIEFWVHNPNYIPREVQLQIFQRSFSTKGVGRGLGTYTMKLLSERYLQGTVSFISSPKNGTIFTASYPLA